MVVAIYRRLRKIVKPANLDNLPGTNVSQLKNNCINSQKRISINNSALVEHSF